MEMIEFVNAKINIGLQIVRRREDGYHDLQTLFYPIGLYAGTPRNPEAFCDMLEVTSAAVYRFISDCAYPEESNLANRAGRLFMERLGAAVAVQPQLRLDKHIPDGAGIGGGSADAAFTLRMLNEMYGHPFSHAELASMALSLGADCPFFLINRAAYAEGVGELLEEVPLNLDGYWLLLARPFVRVSTREAFAGVTPRPAGFNLRLLADVPVQLWPGLVYNDFEDSLFPQFPELAEIKRALYERGALYASLTGSGSCLYGIFGSEREARAAKETIDLPTIETLYLLRL